MIALKRVNLQSKTHFYIVSIPKYIVNSGLNSFPSTHLYQTKKSNKVCNTSWSQIFIC